jgi:hypothetical protein
MKKRLTIFILSIVKLATIFGGGVTVIAANDRNMGSSISISGTGLIDVSLEVNSNGDYSGLGLSQYLYTPSLGMNGPSYMEYSANFELGIYNISEANQTQDIIYTENGMASNVRHSAYLSNYEVGSVAGFCYTGNATQRVEMYGDNALSEIEIAGVIEGKMKLSQMTKDPITRIVLSREMTELKGTYTYDWNSYAEIIEYPASEGKEDWLGCP